MIAASDLARSTGATARCALTAAEYLAFDLGYHMLAVLHDMANYGEALREISASHRSAVTAQVAAVT